MDQIRSANQNDMKQQLDFFGDGESQLELIPDLPTEAYRPDPEKVRAQLLTVLSQVRSARTIPWDRKKAQFWQTVFPQMANWLPEEEAAQLRFEFAQELERLKAA